MTVPHGTWKVGELARLTGLTVRALHHYDEIGLLRPAGRTQTGHRQYTEGDVIKIQQIMSLKELGFSLDEIKAFFDDPEYDPKEVIRMQLERLDREISLKEALRDQLKSLRDIFDSWKKPDLAHFIRSIELIRAQKTYFTPEQIDWMNAQFGQRGQVEAEEIAKGWRQLISSLQSRMAEGTPANDPGVADLAKQWQQGLDFLSGGDAGIICSAERYYADHPDAAERSGMSATLYRYIQDALSHLK